MILFHHKNIQKYKNIDFTSSIVDYGISRMNTEKINFFNEQFNEEFENYYKKKDGGGIRCYVV